MRWCDLARELDVVAKNEYRGAFSRIDLNYYVDSETGNNIFNVAIKIAIGGIVNYENTINLYEFESEREAMKAVKAEIKKLSERFKT